MQNPDGGFAYYTADSLTCRNGQQVGKVSTRDALLAGIAATLRSGNGGDQLIRQRPRHLSHRAR